MFNIFKRKNKEDTQMTVDEKEKLKAEGVRVYLDDSNKTPGWKFAQYEMKGIPLRIEIGPKDLEKGQATLTKRYDGSKSSMPIEEL